MKVFAFQRAYSEDFDPYFVFANTQEEAEQKIREAYPINIFTVYELKELPHPGVLDKQVRGIYTLEATGKTLR